MKSFRTYLTESARTYDFKVRIAGEMDKDIIAELKQCLEAYKLESISAPRRLPIQETPEFPSMGPVEVNVFDVKLAYPVTDAVLRSLIVERAGISGACVKVTPANSPYEMVQDGKEVSNLDGGVVLDEPEMKAAPVDKDLVGDARIPSLIKELEETRKYQYPDAAGGKTPAAKPMPEPATTSPVGSVQNKITSPKK